MQGKLLALAAAALLAAADAHAVGRARPAAKPRIPVASRAGRLGLGVIVGNPSGITGKYWIDRVWAVSFEAGFPGHPDQTLPSLGGAGLGGSVDVAWHKYYVFGKRNWFAYNAPLYLGGGVWSYFPKDGQSSAGVRANVGVTLLFPGSPFDAFVQYSPSVTVTPNFGQASVDGGGIGGRFYF